MEALSGPIKLYVLHLQSPCIVFKSSCVVANTWLASLYTCSMVENNTQCSANRILPTMSQARKEVDVGGYGKIGMLYHIYLHSLTCILTRVGTRPC